MNKLLAISFLTFVSNFAISQEPRYRFILPPRPPQPAALNNTVQAQISNQNINFNTGSSISGVGGGNIGGGGFNSNSGGIQGTGQVTQNNTPGSQLSFLYQLPTATQFQQGGGFGQGGGGFGQGGGGFGQGGNTGGQALGMNNPFYQMAMQGIMAGVGVSAFQSGGQFGGGQFGGGQFGGGQFGGGFNNGGNGI